MVSAQEKAQELYGEKYYASGLGPIPYERSEHWLNFFSIVADEIIRSLHPRRVLDAGCAKGFLVEAFWDRGVHCEGIDVSQYAISQVRSDIREYCSVASLAEPIAGRFDLVTCIEVLEHMTAEEGRAAVGNLCSVADAVLFSSTPSDFDEPTHVNVRPPIYWLNLFAEFNFWPDVRFDACFLTPHAILLKRGHRPEGDLLPLFSDLLRYKAAVLARTTGIQQLEERLRAAQGEVAESLRERVEAAEKLQAELETLKATRAEQAESLRTLEAQLASLNNSLARSNAWASSLEVEQDRAAKERIQLTAQINSKDVQVRELEQKSVASAHEVQELQATLHAVLNSRAWRLAERCRVPLRRLRQDWPRLYRLVRIVGRRILALRRRGVRQAGAHPQSHERSAAANTDSNAEIAPANKDALLRATTPRDRSSMDSGYQRWIEEREPDAQELSRQSAQSDRFPNRPLLSVVIPVYRVENNAFQNCIQSVLKQTYTAWELCVAHAPEGDSRNLDYLRELKSRDGRIRLIELDENGGISQNSNAALDLATGEFIVLLDHDDTLAPFALFEVATRLQEQPDADILYSDHDYLDPENGLRCEPLFKPQWSPEVMLSANYITHLTVLRRSVVEQIGRFDPATDGAQDWDLFFRAADRTSRISHIPKILYHWRMHPESTARNNSAKSYAAEAQLLAIRRHMERCGLEAEPEIRPDGLLHARFHNPPDGMVSIIIPTKDRLDLLARCISTLIERTDYPNFEVLIVDNGSREAETYKYFQSVADDEKIRVIWYPGEFNYSAVNNIAAREARGDFLLFLNNDVEITNGDWLHELAAWANYKPIGIVGARLLRQNALIQHAGVVLGMRGFAGHPFADQPALTFGIAGSTGWYRNFLAVTGACMMMRREVFESLGGFDQRFTLCGSDVEICLRAHEQGYRIVYNPFAELIHHEQQTRGGDVPSNDFVESLKHYRPWLLNGDPYWNANVSLWSPQPDFRYRGEQSSFDFALKHIQAVTTAGTAMTLSAPSQPTEEESIVSWFDCSREQFQYLRSQAALVRGFHSVRRVLWLVPDFENPFYGGIFTVLRFAEYWARNKGVQNLFAICGAADRKIMADRIRKVYANVRDSDVSVLSSMQDAANLPSVDASICTLWTTPYYALHHKNCRRRFYLIQDFEPSFYRAGSISAIVESTYRMGLYGIANTPSLKTTYEAEYQGKAISFRPCINEAVFHPSKFRDRRNSQGPWVVFFYGRPSHPRNSFELLKASMMQLKELLGDRVRIVSAGSEWDPRKYGLQGVVENLGVLGYEESAKLYRESDVGVVMMLTRHPSYIPLELMGSGCLVITNVNSWTSWLLKDQENCLLTCATSTAIAETVQRGLLDTNLRKGVVENALATVQSGYLGWASQMEKVYRYLCDPEALLEQTAKDVKLHDQSVVALSSEPSPNDAQEPVSEADQTFKVGPYDIPVRLAILTGCSSDTFETYGNAQFRLIQRYLNIGPNEFVLEIGCGIGRLAIPATRVIKDTGGYLGIDIIRESIDWCSQNITPQFPHFHFHFVNVSSEIHNPTGTADPGFVKIPLPDSSVDKIFLSSVFTHMFPSGIENYLREFRRVLKPSGLALSTMFLLNQESRRAIENGQTTWKFAHPYQNSEICFVDTLDYPEGAVAYDEPGYIEMIRAQGMDLHNSIAYGTWSGQGRPGADGQDYVIFGPTLPREE